MSYIYVACPYTNINPEATPVEHRITMNMRFRDVMLYTADLLKKKEWAYSPIVHCHEMAHVCNLPKDSHYWEEYNQVMLENSCGVAVLALDGWDESVGVLKEIKWARQHGLPYWGVHPRTYNKLDAQYFEKQIRMEK